jgi:hypothetical protein
MPLLTCTLLKLINHQVKVFVLFCEFSSAGRRSELFGSLVEGSRWICFFWKGELMRNAIILCMLFLLTGIGFGCSARETDDSGGFLAKTGAVPSRGSPDFVTLAKKLQPIVVNVSTTQIAPGPSPRGQPDPEEDPMNELLERFFGQRPSPAYFSDELSFYAL